MKGDCRGSEGVELRKKRPVEGIDAADDEGEIFGEKMMSDLMMRYTPHTSLIARLRLLSLVMAGFVKGTVALGEEKGRQ